VVVEKVTVCVKESFVKGVEVGVVVVEYGSNQKR
jgi:hypothetical protein